MQAGLETRCGQTHAESSDFIAAALTTYEKTQGDEPLGLA